MKIIDLRSDTVTKPTKLMRLAMINAEVGDDVYDEDPSINHLQELAAKITDKEAALFVPSGTQGNLLAILTHCQRGDEYIAGQQAHCYRYEAGGAAVLGGVQPQPVCGKQDGRLDLAKISAMIKPNDNHFARTRLVCLENTFRGRVLSLDYQREASSFVRQRGLKLHLDGARVFNAAVHQGVQVAEITRFYDSVSFCLSKGLGAPVGSILAGQEEFIERARRWRKMLGGGMRQAGILAAAGVYALQNNIHRLTEDHQNALRLAEGLAKVEGLDIDQQNIETNMVFVHCQKIKSEDLVDCLKNEGVLVGGYGSIRLVTHRDFDSADIPEVINAFNRCVNSLKM